MRHSDWIMEKLEEAGTLEMSELCAGAPFSRTEMVRAINDLERQRRAARFSLDGRDWVSRVEPKAPGERRRGRVAAAPALVKILGEPMERNGRSWQVLVFGAPRADDTWAGWLEFRAGEDCARTGAETSQPSFDALAYWAAGLERVYVEGAAERAFGFAK